jgi:hypothetical protein
MDHTEATGANPRPLRINPPSGLPLTNSGQMAARRLSDDSGPVVGRADGLSYTMPHMSDPSLIDILRISWIEPRICADVT